jgi:hypothetical protein
VTPPDLTGRPDPRFSAPCFLLVFVVALAVYRTTLLPGLDFGDTAAFQHAAGDLDLTPRQAYPLYFGLSNLVVALAGGGPAFGMNLASAVFGALAAAVTTTVAIAISGSAVAGVSAGLLLVVSYTFWSQAIIAEVYTLHLLMMALVLLALLSWDGRPSPARLVLLVLLLAFSFGNHLMTVLVLPAVVAFLLTRPQGRQALGDPRTLGVLVACGIVGASLYLWNLSQLWSRPDPPSGLLEALRIFWFDVTKSDWRQSLVMGVHESALTRRAGMYVFDLRQQFGIGGGVLALVGIGALALRRPRLALLLGAAWLVPFIFAYTYNVGDVHVFFLPAHQVTALAMAVGAALILEASHRRWGRRGAAILGVLLVAWPLWRGWDTWPAVDRSRDHRAVHWLDTLTDGLDYRSLLVADLNWQLQNGLDFYQRHIRPDLNVTTAGGRLLTVPFLLRDNLGAGRDVVVTPGTRQLLERTYGGLYRFEPDPRVIVAPLAGRLGTPPRGAVYVLALLAPDRELTLDTDELGAAVRLLTGGTATMPTDASYSVLAGPVGSPPILARTSSRPFRETVKLDTMSVDIRMESWLPADTIRRAGFGHVTRGRRHLLTLERGVSVVILAADGTPSQVEYASGLLAPLPRFLVRRGDAPGITGR